MLEKGIVLELKEAYAIALKPGGEMVRIKQKAGLQVGDRIYILPEDYYTDSAGSSVLPFPARERSKPISHQKKLLRQIAGLAAAIALIASLALYPGVQTVYAVASFDGEQDLQLELDRNSRIMNGYSCGEQLPEETLQGLKGQKLSDVGEELIALTGNGPVLIGYAAHEEDAEEEARTEQLLREIFANHVILYLSGNSEDIELAESTSTSLGLYLAGEVVDEDTREVLDEFLEAAAEYREEDDDSEDEDAFSHLEDMNLEELLQEIRQNPAYAGSEEVLDILADKMEDLHEDHKEQEDADPDGDDDDSDADDDDADSEEDDDENDED